jgi:hypothetical protein
LARASAEVCWDTVAKTKVTPQNIYCVRIDGISLFGDRSQELSSFDIDTKGLPLKDGLENTMKDGKHEVKDGCA